MIHALDDSQVTIINCQVNGTERRVRSVGDTNSPAGFSGIVDTVVSGYGIAFEDVSKGLGGEYADHGESWHWLGR